MKTTKRQLAKAMSKETLSFARELERQMIIIPYRSACRAIKVNEVVWRRNAIPD